MTPVTSGDQSLQWSVMKFEELYLFLFFPPNETGSQYVVTHKGREHF